MSRDTTVVRSAPLGKESESLFDILSKTEQYGLVEKECGFIPEETLTTVSFFHFVEISLKQGFITTIPLLISTPLGIGVVDKILPIFGKQNLTFMDKVFSIMLSVLPALASVLFVAILFSMFYHGNLVRKIRKAIVQGMIIGKAMGTALCFAIFHILYFMVCRNPKFYNWLYSAVGKKFYNQVATVVYDMGDVLIESSWFVVGLFILACLCLWIGTKVGEKKTKRLNQFIEKWDLT